ncbi:MAG: cupredoxin domain-containing protein [Armatimonadota bacterium]
MSRFIAVIAVLVILLSVCGCGGGGQTDSNRNTSVSVLSTSVVPADIAISQGDRIAWTNDASSMRKVVSGTLEPVEVPVVRDAISCLADGAFSPVTLDADLGDTIQWHNMRAKTGVAGAVTDITVEILDASNKVVKSLVIKGTETGSFSSFPRAGKYTYRIAGTTTPTGTLTLSGVPTPDGEFESMFLAEGQRYSTYLNQPGVQSYYIIGKSDIKSSVAAQISVL